MLGAVLLKMFPSHALCGALLKLNLPITAFLGGTLQLKHIKIRIFILGKRFLRAQEYLPPKPSYTCYVSSNPHHPNLQALKGKQNVKTSDHMTYNQEPALLCPLTISL